MKRRTFITAMPAIAAGGLVADAAAASTEQSRFAAALADWEAVQEQGKPISDRHNVADSAHMDHRHNSVLLAPLSVAGGLLASEALAKLVSDDLEPFKQLRFSPHPQFMDLRAFDFEDAQWKIKGLHADLRGSCSAFVDGAALDQSEATALELMDLVLERENAYPVVVEYNAAEAEWNQWLEDEERAFVALCVCPVQTQSEARQKQAVIRECSLADHASNEVWFEALVSSIA